MEHLNIYIGAEIGLFNTVSHSYLSCKDEKSRIRADGIHPFFKVIKIEGDQLISG